MTALRIAGIKLGTGTSIAPGAILKGNRVSIGSGTFINHGLFVDRGQLTIGSNVSIGPGVSFLTRNHEISGSEKRAGKHLDQSIEVESGCWIGANVTVLGGVTIARGCVIAAGAVVSASTEPDGLYAGVPCRLVRHLGDE